MNLSKLQLLTTRLEEAGQFPKRPFKAPNASDSLKSQQFEHADFFVDLKLVLDKAIALGASGFVLKHAASTELLEAIRTARNGGVYVTSEIEAGLQELKTRRTVSITSPSLTSRQREVLQLFAEGNSAREVAASLHISPRTAENHKARIMAQLRLETTADLVQYALRHGIIAAD